jgi:hypothetical protein
MQLLCEQCLTHHLRYRVSRLALSRPTELEPQIQTDHAIQATTVRQAECRYLNYEPRRPLTVEKEIAGRHHHTMFRRQRQDGGTSQRDFLLFRGRDQDKILLNQMRGATRRRITVGKPSQIVVRETRIDCSERRREATIS